MSNRKARNNSSRGRPAGLRDHAAHVFICQVESRVTGRLRTRGRTGTSHWDSWLRCRMRPAETTSSTSLASLEGSNRGRARRSRRVVLAVDPPSRGASGGRDHGTPGRRAPRGSTGRHRVTRLSSWSGGHDPGALLPGTSTPGMAGCRRGSLQSVSDGCGTPNSSRTMCAMPRRRGAA